MRGHKGQFKKGQTPWNKGLHISLNPKSQFTGELHGATHPSWKGGVQEMTRDCVHLYTGPNQRVRRPRKVWEDAHGKIPHGEVIWHVDGDKDNDDIENLECISRAEMMKRNKKLGEQYAESTIP